MSEDPGGRAPDNPDPFTAAVSPHIHLTPSADDLNPSRDFPSFEKKCNIEFSFNGQAIAKTKDWECVVGPDGAINVMGMRVEVLFRSLRTVRPSQIGEQRLYSFALLHSYALKSGSADPELRKAAAEAAAIIAEINPWLPRLRAYCAGKPVPRRLARQRRDAAAVLHLTAED